MGMLLVLCSSRSCVSWCIGAMHFISIQFITAPPSLCTVLGFPILYYIYFYYTLANVVASGSQFSHPSGMEGCVNWNYSEWQIFRMTINCIDIRTMHFISIQFITAPPSMCTLVFFPTFNFNYVLLWIQKD